MSFLSDYKTAFRAENIKRKGTATFLMATIFGAFIPVVIFVFSLTREENPPATIPFNYFQDMTSGASEGLTSLFLPLLIVLTCAKITQIDHRNGGWQLMETLPISKIATYSSKLTIVLITNLICILSFVVCTTLFAWIAHLLGKTPAGVEMDVPWGFFFQFTVRMFVATLFFTILQFVLSTLFSSFIISILIGVTLTIGTGILRGADIEKVWNPITILAKTSKNAYGSDLNHWLLYTEKLSLIAFITLFIVGFIWFKSKSLKRVFTKRMNAIATISALVIGFLLVYYLLIPNHLPKHHRTVIAGEFDSDENISKLILSESFMRDTIVEIPVKDNKFHYIISEDLPLKQYTLLVPMKENNAQIHFPFQTNDSIFFKHKIAKNNIKIISIKGNQLADLQYNSEKVYNKLWTLEYWAEENNQPLDKIDRFVEEAYSVWTNRMNTTNSFRTKDNYALSEDLLLIHKKLFTLKILNYWRAFEEKIKHSRPDIVENLPKEIQEIKEFISFTDHSLLDFPEYLQYILNELTKKDTTEIALQTKQLNAITTLNDPIFKDQLLFYTLNESLQSSFDTNERSELIQNYASLIENTKIRNRIKTIYRQGEKVSRGSQSFDFEAENLESKTVRLSDFKGKYVVIDVWATWCGPCKYDYPYFEKYALKYKNNPNFVFVGMNADSKREAWLQDVQNKSKSIVQLRPFDSEMNAFKENYNITKYPTYILLDKDGKFISAQMPRPTEDHFEQMLKDLEKQN
ncbi:redoxin family protein [Capnocytophaga canis]|uniref:Putative Peroxiredoxin n=1 Tax=Capnocytophaga canis TaxID=1848903 RepID=A0A0B7IW38_9FLAO|nr:redoxin family protein [Capnocytophaga canis]CEN54292.1 putative Peroxiredoxin [Capnocytophaga canis]